MDDRARAFFLKHKHTVTVDTHIGVFDQGICAKACAEGYEVKKPFKRSSNHIVTKTDPMELNKRHRHSNCSTEIPVMLCYIPWIRNVTCQCLFHREE
jgi:hypothetical protein